MLNILSWNCAGGIRGKMDEIKHIISQTSPDLFFICEAEYSGKNETYFNVQNYQLDTAESYVTCMTRSRAS